MARKVRSKRADAQQEQDTPIWKRPIVWGAVATALVIAVVLIVVAKSQGGSSAGAAATTFWDTIPTDGRTAGPDDAAVKIVEYSDYSCPHCRDFHEQALTPLAEEYIADGSVQLEVQPVAYLGEDSQRASEAALCAQDQGQFWPYHDQLFVAQGRYGRSAFTDSRLKEYAADLGLDEGQFGRCLDSGEHYSDVIQITREAQSRGVTGTPTAFVNGQKIGGAISYEQLVNQYVQQYVE